MLCAPGGGRGNQADEFTGLMQWACLSVDNHCRARPRFPIQGVCSSVVHSGSTLFGMEWGHHLYPSSVPEQDVEGI